MSAPKTNVEKQKKWHQTPLLGMGAVVLGALILLVLLGLFVVFRGNEPESAEEVVDGRTGEVEELDEAEAVE